MRSTIKGFTLVELMITIGILSLIFGYFMIYYYNEIRLYHSKDTDIELKQDARIAIDKIVSKIRSNYGLTYAPGPDGTGIIYKGTQIIINTTKNDPNGEINFWFDNAKGYGEIRNETGQKIVGNIKDFKLEKQDIGNGTLIKIIVSVGKNNTSTLKQFSTAVRLR